MFNSIYFNVKNEKQYSLKYFFLFLIVEYTVIDIFVNRNSM